MPKVGLPRDWKFGSVPAAVFDTDLSPHAKLLIAAITFHAFDGGKAWPSKSRLSRFCSCSEKKIYSAIKELETAGWLQVTRKEGCSNDYIFIHKTQVRDTQVTEGPKYDVPDTQVPDTRPPGYDVPANETNTTRHKNETTTPPTIKTSERPFNQIFIEWYSEAYQQRFGRPYGASKADFVQASSVLRAFSRSEGDFDALKALVRAGWSDVKQSRDGFSIASACMTVKGFCSVVNRISLPIKTLTPKQEAELREKEKGGY